MLRLLHTGDWHLGRTLRDFSRDYEHAKFLDWLLDALGEQEIDALIVAGDVFDSGNPSAAALKLWFEFLARAAARFPRLDVVVVGGNHDSPARLEAPRELIEAAGRVRIVGALPRLDDEARNLDLGRLLIPLRGRDDQIAAWCAALPYLRLGDLPGNADPASPETLIAGARAIHDEVLRAAAERREPGQAIIATGHCHMVGGQVSELSERRIVIGGESALPADIFGETPAYVALGHLHRPQLVGKLEHIRYSGSPFPLAMDEASYQHQVLIAEFEGAERRECRSLEVPRFVEFIRVPKQGALPPEELLAALDKCLPRDDKDAPPKPREAWAFAEARALLSGPEPDLRARIEKIFDKRPARLAAFRAEAPAEAASSGDARAQPRRSLADTQPEDVFQRLYAERYPGEDIPAELLGAFHLLLEEARGSEGEEATA